MRSIITIFISIASIFHSLYAQCTPPGTDNCKEALVLCSLDELNGYTCQNVDYSNPTACLPCNGQGGPHNTSWWAFVTSGGNVTITIDFFNCVMYSGVQMGIVSACDCSGQIACQPNCSGPGTFTINGDLQPCKIYYLWVDGCGGDVCTFTITTNGGYAPKLGNLSAIKRSVPDPICKGCCSDFWVDPQPSGCKPNYVWTNNGNTVVCGVEERINICFPEEGNFSICVEAIIGNPDSGSFCDSKMKCTNVVIKKPIEERAKSRIICANNIPYHWHCQIVTSSGEYRCPFLKNGCCEFDSVLQITILPKPKIGEKYFIGCMGENYIDTITNEKFTNCQNRTEVYLKKSQLPYQCDSSYYLYAVFPHYIPLWNSRCNNDTVTHEPRIKKVHRECGLNISYEESYTWYNKSDSNKIISNKSFLNVIANGEYCLIFNVKIKLGSAENNCTWTFCEEFNENEKLKIDIQLAGADKSKENEILKYATPNQQSNQLLQYIWKVKGGTILTPNAQDSSEIRVLWDKLDTANYVCVSIMTECTTSPEQCINITKQTNTAISDLNKYSIINILPNPNNGNFIISWDKNLFVNKLSIISVEGKEIYESKISKNQTDIHLKDQKLKPGIYYARLNSKDKNYTKAFVVQ